MLIAAIGNRFRSDDAVAFDVADSLKRELAAHIRIAHTDHVLSLIEEWSGQDLVIVIDAVQSGASAGSLHEIDATERPLPAIATLASSHDMDLAHAIEIARQLGRLPRKLVIVGIEAARFDHGTGLSPQVAAAVPLAAALVRRIADDALVGA